MPAPKVFGIGLPHSGGEVLQAVFEANGHRWLHHRGGKLAQSIAYAQAAGTAPLAEWPKAAGFSDLYRMHKRHLPDLRVQDLITYLFAQFPDAYFINTIRDPADWVAARFWADDGDHRIASAWHANVTEAELPTHWLDEQARHHDDCARLFGNNDRYLEFKVTTDPIENIFKFLSADFDLATAEVLPDLSVSADKLEAVLSHLDRETAARTKPQNNISFATQVSDFCTEFTIKSGRAKSLSRSAISWTADGKITDRTDTPVNMARSGEEGPYLLKPDSDGFERAQGTLNEMIAHGARPPLQIDMMDARFIGSQGRNTPPPRTIAYNRRKGAKNLTLWPLPGYHTLAPTGQVGGFPTDEISFADKTDRCVWLGNMTGRMSPVLTPNGRAQRGVYKLRDEAEGLGTDSPHWDNLIADMGCVPRYNIVKTYRDHPDFEVGLVLRAKWKRLAHTPAFAGLCSPKRPRTWFHQFRYILSLAGNDTGSNFLMAASSNALILKEEDGWELFYTNAFKPWVHYVPLEEGALDVEEKLAWARANPDKSKQMSLAATEMYDRFADPANRAAILKGITAHLNGS